MARLPRLVLPGLAHLVSLPALPGIDPYPDAADRHRLVALLHECTATEATALLAYALLPGELRLLLVPQAAPALGRYVQAVGRKYVAHFNRQRRRAGTLWAGRFRSAPVQPGEWALAALRFVDTASTEPERTAVSSRTGSTGGTDSAAGGGLTHPPEFWRLGNTPFERERRYAELVAEPLNETTLAKLRQCLAGGWLCADDGYAGEAQPLAIRQVQPRPRGRPRKLGNSSTAN